MKVCVSSLFCKERGKVDRRGPTLGTVHQEAEVIWVDVQPHLLIQQGGGFLLGEGELLGADLVELSCCPETPQRQLWVGATGENEVDVLGKVLHEEGHRVVTDILGYELVIVEHQYHSLRRLGE